MTSTEAARTHLRAPVAERRLGGGVTLSAVNWKALAIATAGLLLTFAAPAHRVDLLLEEIVDALVQLVVGHPGGPR